MKSSPKAPWTPQWAIVRELSGGGQAATFIVQHTETGAEAVLKKLRRQDDAERRRRMHREVTVLQTFDHSGIPRLIESNSTDYATDVLLYLIVEFIPGKTLNETIENRTMSVDHAGRFLVSLLRILEYTHQNGIVHRDIKPDNIIQRIDAGNYPVLIDFGLSFNRAEEATTSLTHSNQQLGNRFLGLPELQLKSSLQHDPRSDLTQTVGVLFYAITGVFPVTLMDESSRLPHQRENVLHYWQTVPKPVRHRLLRIFDRGFTLSIDRRWQSAEELRRAIEGIHAPASADTEDKTIELGNVGQQLAEAKDYTRCQTITSHIDRLLKKLDSVFESIARDLGPDFVRVQSGRSIDWKSLTFGNSLGISHKFIDAFSFLPLIEGEITGNEIVVFSRSDGEYTEFVRFPINGQPDLEQFGERLVEFYKGGIARTLKSVI